jgi:TRAP-type C4-dicarboxylate transport system substrate-binding protein
MFATGSRRCILAVLLTCILSGAALAQKPAPDSRTQDSRIYVMKLAAATVNDGQHEWMRRFAAAIETRSGGRIKAEIYPAGQLGSIPRMIESTQLGSIQIFMTAAEFFAGLDPRFELLTAGGVIESEQHAVRVAADPAFSKAFLAIGANRGLIGVDLFIAGPAAFATRKPFRTLADLKGAKIRILASPLQIEQVARLGATGVPMSLGDVLPALQQGTIDGSLAHPGIFTTLRYYDVTRYMNETAHAFTFSFVAMSKRWFDALPADLQPIVLATATEAGTGVNQWQIDFLTRQHRVWIENGGELDTLPPAEHADMMVKMTGATDDIVKTKPELRPMWELLRAAAKRNM